MIDTSRHMSLISPRENPAKIGIIGAGATGSYVAYSLAKLGYTGIEVYDFDKIESHNIANQMYSIEDVDEYKSHALERSINDMTGAVSIIGYSDKVDISFMDKYVDVWKSFDVIFLLVDTLTARAEIYDWLERHGAWTKCIETRLAATHGDVYSFRTNHFTGEKWRSELPSDDEIERDVTACGSSVTIGQSAILLANYAVWAFIDLMLDQEVPYHRWYEFRQGMTTTNEYKA